jgi:hypothetical protein
MTIYQLSQRKKYIMLGLYADSAEHDLPLPEMQPQMAQAHRRQAEAVPRMQGAGLGYPGGSEAEG